MNDLERKDFTALLRNHMDRGSTTSEKFAESLRARYLRNRKPDAIKDAVEKLKIVLELREQGGHHADVADLAEYGAMMLRQYVHETT